MCSYCNIDLSRPEEHFYKTFQRVTDIMFPYNVRVPTILTIETHANPFYRKLRVKRNVWQMFTEF